MVGISHEDASELWMNVIDDLYKNRDLNDIYYYIVHYVPKDRVPTTQLNDAVELLALFIGCCLPYSDYLRDSGNEEFQNRNIWKKCYALADMIGGNNFTKRTFTERSKGRLTKKLNKYFKLE